MARDSVMASDAVASMRAEGWRRVELSAVERRDASVVIARRRRRVEAVGDGVAAAEHGVRHHREELFIPLQRKTSLFFHTVK